MGFCEEGGLDFHDCAPAESLQRPHGPFQGPPIASFPTPEQQRLAKPPRKQYGGANMNQHVEQGWEA